MLTALGSAEPRLIPCEEQGPVDLPVAELLDLAGHLDLNSEIESGDYFAVSVKGGNVTLRARGMIGYIPLNERVVVHVRPRVPISNLSRVLEVSGYPPTVLTSTRPYATHGEWNESLLDVYAEALIRHVETIVSAGLLREYVRREEVSSFPHGRVQVHRTLQSMHPRGIRHQAHVSFFERTADNAPNRALKYAIWVLAHRYAGLGQKTREQRMLHRRLGALFNVFGGVGLDHTRRFLPDPVVLGAQPLPTLRSYYRDALTVALAIIQQRAVLIESTEGSVRLPSIVVNMNKVFEAYVRSVLDVYARTHRWDASVLDGNTDGAKRLFDTRPSPDATPDVVIREPGGSTPLVIEVKNIPVKDVFSERGAIEQAITYAMSYRAPRALLVHPRASAYQPGGLHRVGDLNGIHVDQYRLDLGASDLAAEEERFGSQVATLL